MHSFAKVRPLDPLLRGHGGGRADVGRGVGPVRPQAGAGDDAAAALPHRSPHRPRPHLPRLRGGQGPQRLHRQAGILHLHARGGQHQQPFHHQTS